MKTAKGIPQSPADIQARIDELAQFMNTGIYVSINFGKPDRLYGKLVVVACDSISIMEDPGYTTVFPRSRIVFWGDSFDDESRPDTPAMIERPTLREPAQFI